MASQAQIQNAIDSLYENSYNSETGQYDVPGFIYFDGNKVAFTASWTTETIAVSGYADTTGILTASSGTSAYGVPLYSSMSGNAGNLILTYNTSSQVAFSQGPIQDFTITFDNGAVQNLTSGYFGFYSNDPGNALLPGRDNTLTTIVTGATFINNMGANQLGSYNIPIEPGSYSYDDLTSALHGFLDNDFPGIDYPTNPGEKDDPSDEPGNDKKGQEKLTKDEVPAFFNRQYQVGNTTSFYALNAAEVSSLRTILTQQSDNFYEAVKKIGASSFYEFINSFRFWPINYTVSSTRHEVKFANETLTYNDTPVGLRVLTNSAGTETISYKNTYICFWDLSQLKWENNFLDYEPYTKLTITLPYVGTQELDLLQISSFGPLSEAFLRLYATIDFETGVLCYCLTLYNPTIDKELTPLLIKQIKIAVDIALNANNATAQSDAILSAGFNNFQKSLNLVNAGTNMVTTFKSSGSSVGNKIGAATGLAGAVADQAKGIIDYANATRAIPVTIGANSGSIASTFYCQYPYLTHYHPRTANPDNYGSAVGYLWEGTATIKNLSGFSIARNPKLDNIKATEEEKNLISQILTSGFYV